MQSRNTLKVLYLFVFGFIFQTGFAQVEWSIQLRDGIAPLEGRVEIFIEDSWKVVVDNDWDLQDAHVVCRQLGFPRAKTALTNLSVSPSVQAHITSVQCQGQEPSLAQCPFTISSEKMTKDNEIAAAGVVCAVEFSLRLVSDTTSHNQGYLEILDQTEQWRRVCLDNWDQSDAMIACRQLGYQELIFSSNDSTSSSNAVAVLSTNCSGEEFHLQGCASFQLQLNNCNSEHSVTLGCIGTPNTPSAPRVNSASCSSLTISWRSPENRGSSITHYFIRYKQSTYYVWNEVNVTLEITTLENLLPMTLYEIQINAVNEIGNSSFSDITYAWTTSPDQQPAILEPQQIESTSASFLWNISNHCGGQVTHYEIVYKLNSLDDDYNETTLFLSSTLMDQNQEFFTIDRLRPHSVYSVQVRSVTHVGENQQFVSNFSEIQLFMTSEGVPSDPPQSFTGYLSHRQDSANFRWSAVDMRSANGLLTGYNFSCNYTSDGHIVAINKSFDNSTFQFKLTNIVDMAEYECVIAASTRAGKGPNSAPVYFTTPDFNRPRPPFNVAYALIDTVDADRENFLVQAMWSINECRFNFSCFEVLGYIIQCRHDDDEIRKIIWRNELETDQNNSFGETTFSAKPFRTYQCAMAAINAYGFGHFGSAVDVKIPQLKPVQSPMHLYASMVQPNSVTINWRYNENPPVGKLVGFYVSYYLQDERYPNQNGEPIDENRFLSFDNSNQVFSHVINEHLSPGVSYNVYVAAVTEATEGGGTGPQASMSVTTLRSAPPNVPSLLQNKRDTSTEPFQFTFIWEYSINQRADAVLLGGFILHCYTNVSNSTEELFSHVYFVERVVSLEEQYSMRLRQHVTCASKISSYMCDVRAFNEMGEGPTSTPTTVYLPCITESGSLQDSFLADPYVGVVLLVLLFLLIAVVSILGVMLCYYVRQNYLNQRIIAEKFASYTEADTYDEGYIDMAPSGATAKPFVHNGRNGNLPQLPGVHLPALGESTDDPYNHYDRIPADRNSKGDNVYDEINLRGARIISAARGRQGLNTGTQNILEVSSIHNNDQLSEIEESQVTTVTMLASQGPESYSMDANELKLNELQRAFSISPTQSTDYIEMSGATGKKMGKAERNLLDRSATSLSNNSSIGGTPKRAKYNPYSYDTSTGHQLDPDKDQANENMSIPPNIKTAQESTFSRHSPSSGIQKRLSNTSNNSAVVGCSTTTSEQLHNGQDEVDKEQAENLWSAMSRSGDNNSKN